MVGQRLVDFLLDQIRGAPHHGSKPRDDLFGFRLRCAAILLGVNRLGCAVLLRPPLGMVRG
jgi:hypothetical protein